MNRSAPAAAGTGLQHQLAMLLRRRITSGQWRLGERLPTLSELSEEFQVSRVTMQQALTFLADEGLISRRRGRGTFVIAEPLQQRWFTLSTDFAGLLQPGPHQHSRLLETHRSKHLPPHKPDLGTLAEEYQYLHHLHWHVSEPSAVTEIHLARDIYERVGSEVFEAKEVMPLLGNLEGLKLWKAHQTLTIGAADMEIARLLEVPLNTPLAELRRVVLEEGGRIVYFGHLVFRGDLLRLDFTLTNH